ncbi:ABC-type sugar transport system ATPase subunit [Brucella pseudogrignonensis]|uniref:ABC-type sugar transport system ATPase subunit n=1 Tax=Brucella pseudogrignonensis TaxID=419475 RepID=A0ABU1MEU4_9HYPH|nr:ATP-binding cassette domain-containing protein [Brucella pseudogrignonensis]MDR6434569.1 ABC-type sugar transport system ATPase subunit [Brucella pseudogrignonensis]
MKFVDAIVNELAPSERNIAMLFQDYALYPHMSVEDNMAFGLKMRGSNDNDVSSRIGTVAETLKIGEFLERRPAQLSGGQRQPIAMRLEIAKLHGKIKATTVYVTHDQIEAMTLADRIVVMNKGNVEQIGSPTMNALPTEVL